MTNKIIKVHCNTCSRETRHEVLHNEDIRWSEDIDHEYTINGGSDYDLLKCCGCENVCLRHQTWMSEDADYRGDLNIKTVFYPPASFRKEPKWISELKWEMPKQQGFVAEFIGEIYVALRSGSLRLAVMGIRALLEQVMIDKVGDHKTFKANLDAFEKEGFVSKAQRSVLEPVIEAGHATMHRSFKPTTEDVGHLMDVTESVVESVYINAHRALAISKRVPARGTKSPAKLPATPVEKDDEL